MDIRKALEQETTQAIEKAKQHIMNGGGLKYWSTAHSWEQLQKGIISHETAEARAIKRATHKNNKTLQAELEKIGRCINKPQPRHINISVVWRRSNMWGYNPTATVVTEQAKTTGFASGCGYDKLSTAVAEALNKQDGIKGALYRRKNEQPDTTNHKLLGYGSGYGILPYMEGGVGMPSLKTVLSNIGYDCIADYETETTNNYVFVTREV